MLNAAKRREKKPERIMGIVHVRNRLKTTLRFLQTVDALEIPDGMELDVLVIDDGSTDGTAEAIRREHPRMILDEQDGSLYWSGAIQRGLEIARSGDYAFVWLLNDDIELEKDVR